MDQKPYELKPDEKATQVMIGTHDMLLWGDLLTKEQARMSAFLSTLAEDFVPLHDARILSLAPTQQAPPLQRAIAYIKLEEILFFYVMAEDTPLPEESEVRRYEPVEVIAGSFLVEGQLLKSPIATMQNLLLVTKDDYMPFYRATVRHVAKPWLGRFSADMVQVRRDRLTLIVNQ
jgi:hypothetical protein